jgi:Flp pilus assembly protein TadG
MRRPRDDRGSLSIEYVILTPMIFFVLALIYVFARMAEVNGVLDAGTRDATRVASLAGSEPEAQRLAEQTVAQELNGRSATCKSSLTVDILGDFAPGNTITVKAQCSYPISDAGVPGAPGTLTVHSQFSTIIDPNKSP